MERTNRFFIYSSWDNFSIGVNWVKQNITGWKHFVGIDIGFIGLGVYFGKRKNK